MTDINQHRKNTPPNKIIRWPSVKERVGISRSHAHYLIQKGEFPTPIKLGGENARSSGWLEHEIDEWIENRIAESRNKDLSKG